MKIIVDHEDGRIETIGNSPNYKEAMQDAIDWLKFSIKAAGIVPD